MSEWISVNDRMPPRDTDVLVFIWGGCSVGRFDKRPVTLEDRWEFEDYNLYGEEMNAVTHWMPLPEPPKEEDHERVDKR